MWSLPTLEDGHEQAIRYGTVFGWRADGVACDATAAFAAGESYPGRDSCAVAAGDALGLAEKAYGLVFEESLGTVW